MICELNSAFEHCFITFDKFSAFCLLSKKLSLSLSYIRDRFNEIKITIRAVIILAKV